MFQHALGLIETRGLVGALEAADAALKTSHVRLIGTEYADAGLVTVKIAGETAAVRAAVDAAGAAAGRVGELVSVHVIPRPHEELTEFIEGTAASVVKKNKTAQQPEAGRQGASGGDVTEYRSQLEHMTVHQLRSHARSVGNLSIQGRQISMANKQQLIDELVRARFG